MALVQATKSHETTYTLDDAMDILLTKLDDAIHDMEAGRVQTIGEEFICCSIRFNKRQQEVSPMDSIVSAYHQYVSGTADVSSCDVRDLCRREDQRSGKY